MEPLLDRAIDGYLDDLAASEVGDPVLTDMERRASELGFPIVGRAVGRFLEWLASLAGVSQVIELGSGFGYSAFFFARAVGKQGRVICTDGDPDNAQLAESYLRRAQLWERIDYRVGDALATLDALDEPLELVYCDIDKHGYPAAWAAVADRLPLGGLFVCDNVLWSGRVAGLAPPGEDPAVAAARDADTPAIRAMTREITDDPRYATTLVPIRDGVLAARRVA
ncbi:MAG: O-methyltransferase [Actinomycetota bacterium]